MDQDLESAHSALHAGISNFLLRKCTGSGAESILQRAAAGVTKE